MKGEIWMVELGAGGNDRKKFGNHCFRCSWVQVYRAFTNVQVINSLIMTMCKAVRVYLLERSGPLSKSQIVLQ